MKNTASKSTPQRIHARWVLACRRTTWLVGVVPVWALSIALFVGGSVLLLSLCGILWLTGSDETLEGPMEWVTDLSIGMTNRWKRLLSQNNAPVGAVAAPDEAAGSVKD